MNEEIVQGSVVSLKSGGPNMTVERISKHDGDCYVSCVWFVDNVLQKNTFVSSCLQVGYRKQK